ncbi:MAG: NAD(P)H-binding protein [Moraxella sp.]|nr:NAD(P)H-binding protein [Moraxella sp.]
MKTHLHALIIGATGATGTPLTEQLLTDERFEKVTVFARRAIELTHPKLTVHIVDFDTPDTWADKVRGDVLFGCLGTTLKQAGGRPKQYKIDHDYTVNIANIARQNGVRHMIAISSDGANPNSPLFYYRLKGDMEKSLSAIGFDKLTLMRPPLLKRQNSDRMGERLSEKVLEMANRFGLLMSAKPMPTDTLAKAMRQAVFANKVGVVDKGEIWGLAK